LIGRTPIDWTPPAARSPHAVPPVPRETRAVWIDPAHGWRDVPVYVGEALRPGCTLPGPLLLPVGLAVVVVLGAAAVLSGMFARQPLLFWIATAYVALLPLEVRLAI